MGYSKSHLRLSDVMFLGQSMPSEWDFTFNIRVVSFGDDTCLYLLRLQVHTERYCHVACDAVAHVFA